MIESLWACWIDESPQWNLICFQVVQSSVLCMHCNELNLHFLKTVDVADNSQSQKDSAEGVVALSQSVVISNCYIYKKHEGFCDNNLVTSLRSCWLLCEAVHSSAFNMSTCSQ